MKGIVYLVGAGPGDPGLITVKGLDLLQRADAVVYDRLVNPALLEEIPAGAEKHYAGKSTGCHSMAQEEINELLVSLGGEGKVVVRLKGGDPFVFGRGGEEALALADAGIPFEIVPGVSAGTAAAAYAGIPVTHRGMATQCLLVTAHESPDKPAGQVAWERIAALEGVTVTGYMGVKSLPHVTEELIKGGKDPATPAAVIAAGTTSDQRTVTADLGTIAAEAKAAGLVPPALFVIGETVALAGKLGWFGNKALAGKRIVITRARDQAAALAEPLRTLGAEIIHLPVIRTAPIPAGDNIRHLFSGEHWDWIVFSSENGVRYFADSLKQARLDARALADAHIAAVGSGTANRLRLCGLEPDFVPSSFTTRSLAEELNAAHPLEGRKVLRVGPVLDPDPLAERLAELGAALGELRVYELLPGEPLPEVVADLKERGAHACAFTSGSTVRNFFRVLGPEDATRILCGARAFAIGPVTSGVLAESGVTDAVVAEEHSIPGLLRVVRENLQ